MPAYRTTSGVYAIQSFSFGTTGHQVNTAGWGQTGQYGYRDYRHHVVGVDHELLANRIVIHPEIHRRPYALPLPQDFPAGGPAPLEQPVADTVAVADAVSIVHDKQRTLADTVALTDTPARVVTDGRTVADTLALADVASPVKSGAHSVPLADSIALTDARAHDRQIKVGAAGAAPSVSDVQAGTGATGSSANASAPLPADVVAGDMLVFISTLGTPQTVNTDPSGWGSPIHSDDTLGSAGIRVYAKIASGSEGAPTVAYAGSASWSAIVIRVRGGALPSQLTAQSSGFPPTTASIDPPAGALKFGIVYVDPSSGVVVQTWSGGATTLANVMNGTNGINMALSVAVKAEDTAGALAGNQNWFTTGAVVFAVESAPVAGDGVALTDSPSRAVAAARTVADTLALTDSPSRTVAAARTVADTLALADARTIAAAKTKALADQIGGAAAVWAVDQATLGVELDTNYGGARTYTLDAAVAAGAWVFIGINWAASANLSSVSGGGLTWSVVQESFFSGETKHAALAYAYAPAGLAASTVISFTLSSGDHGNWKAGASSFTGGDASSFDTSDGANGTGTGWTTDTLTTAEAGELIVACCAVAGFEGTSSSPTSPAVELIDNSVTAAHVVLQYRTAALAGATSTGGTLSGSFAYGVASVAMKLGVSSGLVDAVSLGRGKAVTDGLVLTDATLDSQGIRLGDTIVTSDLLSRAVTASRTLADTLALLDSASPVNEAGGTSHSRPLADTIVLTDSLTRTLTIARTLTDPLALADARVMTRGKVVADSIVVADARTIGAAKTKALADTLVLSDAFARTMAYGRTQTDGLILADSAVDAQGIRLGDVVVLVDVLSRLSVSARQVADSLALTDSVGIARGKNVADALALADALAKSVAAARSLTDSVVLADQLSRAVTLARTVADTVALTDARTAARAKSLADAVVLADQLARVSTVTRTVADTVLLSDATLPSKSGAGTLSPADLLVVSDSFARLATFVRTVADSVTVSDSVAAAKGRALALADVLALSDNVVRARDTSRLMADSLGVADLLARVSVSVRNVADGIAVTDAVLIGFAGIHTRTVADLVAISDSLQRSLAFSRVFTDGVALSDDAATALVRGVIQLASQVFLGDAFARVATYARTPADVVALFDAIVIGFAGEYVPADIEFATAGLVTVRGRTGQLVTLEGSTLE